MINVEQVYCIKLLKWQFCCYFIFNANINVFFNKKSIFKPSHKHFLSIILSYLHCLCCFWGNHYTPKLWNLLMLDRSTIKKSRKFRQNLGQTIFANKYVCNGTQLKIIRLSNSILFILSKWKQTSRFTF